MFLAIKQYNKFLARYTTSEKDHIGVSSDPIRVRSDNIISLPYVNNMLRASIKFLQQIG